MAYLERRWLGSVTREMLEANGLRFLSDGWASPGACDIYIYYIK